MTPETSKELARIELAKSQAAMCQMTEEELKRLDKPSPPVDVVVMAQAIRLDAAGANNPNDAYNLMCEAFEMIVSHARSLEEELKAVDLSLKTLESENERLVRRVEELDKKRQGIGDHKEPCFMCGEPINNLAGNPGLWGMRFPKMDSSGTMAPHHMGCITKKVHERDLAQRQLAKAKEGLLSIQDIAWHFPAIKDRAQTTLREIEGMK